MLVSRVALGGLLAFLAIGRAGANATEAQRRATVVTAKGEVIEGILRGANDAEVALEVAGQVLKLPTSSVKYISFSGRLEATAPAPETPIAGSMEDAFKALSELQGALKIGVLRAQYSDKLVQTLPRVLAFAESPGEDWSDVKAALFVAISLYKQPLGAPTQYYNPWTEASAYFAAAGRHILYAQLLSQLPEEKTHRESSAEAELQLGVEVSGRLGVGDRKVTKNLSAELEGRLADAYRIRVMVTSKLLITAAPNPCGVKLMLVDSLGKKLAEKDAELKRDVPVGSYSIWVVTNGGVGVYKLKAIASR